MRTTFRLSESLTDDTYVHLICLNPVAVYQLPECTCISGNDDPDLQKKALEWYQNHIYNQTSIKKIIPPGYIEAIQIVRENIDLIDIYLLSV